MKAVVALSLLLLAGCATEPRVVVRTQEVRVPVYQQAVAPEVLLSCGHSIPDFKFYPAPDNGATLVATDQDKFRSWVDRKDRCIKAWAQWASPE